MTRLKQPGFTIVELLIVIVVIGILAAITIVAYNGIQGRAIAATLQSDLDSASKQLKLYQVDHSAYPTINDCSASPAANSICLKSSGNTTYTAFQISNTSNPQTFCLTATNSSQNYDVTQEGSPGPGVCPIFNLDAAISSSYPKSGSVFTDLSGNGNNGSLVGDVSYSGIGGGALTFDGVSSYVNVPQSSSLDFGSGDFSVSFWCYRTASGYSGGSYIVKGGLGTPGIDTYDGIFRVDTSTGSLARIGLWASYNVWENHVFVVTQSSAPYIKHYINNVLNQTGYSGTGATGSINNANGLIIGRSYAGGIYRYYNGSIGSVRLYNKALSTDEISQNFSALRGRYGL